MACIILTGVPGIGKSTAGRELAARNPYLRYLNVGDVFRASFVTDDDSRVDDVRLQLDQAVSFDKISEVKQRLQSELDALGDEQIALLDSHTATATWYGVRATPDGPDRLRKQEVIAYVQLTASPATIAARRAAQEAVPRHGNDDASIALQQHILIALTVAYAQSIQVPAYFVDADGNVESVIEKLSAVVEYARDWRAASTTSRHEDAS